MTEKHRNAGSLNKDPGKVYHISAEAERRGPRGMLSRMGLLLEAAGGRRTFSEGDLVALKLSFSEWGNTACLRPQYVRQVVDWVKHGGGKPFLTDANTLYSGGRSNAVDHIHTALMNGFGFDATGAPIIIADGLTGRSSVRVSTGAQYAPEPRIAAEVHSAHALISLAHIHGHMGTGFAGTIKNVGMGLGCRAGKQEMHSQKDPPVCDVEKCTVCGDCVASCQVEAITLTAESAEIDEALCIRCGECTAACPEGAIAIRWGDEPGMMQRRMVDYTQAVLQSKGAKVLFLTFLMDVCPDCLCADFNRPAMIPDVGILASRDPVAVDQASFDLVKAQQAVPGSLAKGAKKAGQDKFAAVYPEHDSEVCMAYAEEAGLGTRRYTLEEV